MVLRFFLSFIMFWIMSEVAFSQTTVNSIVATACMSNQTCEKKAAEIINAKHPVQKLLDVCKVFEWDQRTQCNKSFFKMAQQLSDIQLESGQEEWTDNEDKNSRYKSRAHLVRSFFHAGIRRCSEAPYPCYDEWTEFFWSGRD